jgi:hypothetical protein
VVQGRPAVLGVQALEVERLLLLHLHGRLFWTSGFPRSKL